MRKRPDTNSPAINELSELVASLLASVRKLPPGPERHAALIQIGLFQVRLDSIEAQSNDQVRGILPQAARQG
jgi:hypothetical protein